MDEKITESEKLLNEEQENKRHLEERLVEKEKTKEQLETNFNKRNKDKDNLINQIKEKEREFSTKKEEIINQIKEKEREFSTKKEKFYRIIKFIKTVIEKNKIRAEINELEKTGNIEKNKIQIEIDKLNKIKNSVNESIIQIKGNIEAKEREIYLLKEAIKSKQNEISFILSQRERDMELFESRWVKRLDIPKLKEARLGITNNFSNLSPFEFEHFVAKLLREMGYSTKVTQKTGDYGVDIIVRKDNDIVAVQCKRFQEGNLVSNRDIQRILGAMRFVNANKCIFVTTSTFTKQAIQQAKGCPIELWDKEIFHNLVKKYLLDLEIKEIFSLMEKEKQEKLEREQERIRLLEEKREGMRLKREEKKRKLEERKEERRRKQKEKKEAKRKRIEERKEREEKRRACPICHGLKMKNRKYCSNCKREIRMENKYDDYW